jgi:hypothetical protein
VTQIAVLVVVVIVLAVLALWFLRHRHTQYEAILGDLWRRLQAVPPGPAFDPEAEAVAELPSAARRYLTHAIAAGTPLAGSVVLALEGRMGLQPGAEKTRFKSRQVLSLPKGMIWQAVVGEGFQAVSGADAYADGVGESRFYLWRAIPVASGAGPDVSRSAAGRVALESVLFLPSALHPGFPHGGPQGGARWEHVDDRTARVHLTVGDHELVPEVQVAPDGHLLRIEMMRWDPEGPSGEPEEVRWVVDGFGEEETFGGHTLPTTFRVTKNAGTAHVDTFFEGHVTSADYEPGPPVPEEPEERESFASTTARSESRERRRPASSRARCCRCPRG